MANDPLLKHYEQHIYLLQNNILLGLLMFSNAGPLHPPILEEGQASPLWATQTWCQVSKLPSYPIQSTDYHLH